MTQEDKKLLLKDLCSRVPYGVKCKYNDGVIVNILSVNFFYAQIEGWERYVNHTLKYDVEDIKPYLFPLSSMTEEQQEEFDRIYADDMQVVADNLKNRLDGKLYETNFGHYRHIDWLNAHHFDYRGLIPMGLAIDATGKNIY
jgi:hypothetical protein